MATSSSGCPNDGRGLIWLFSLASGRIPPVDLATSDIHGGIEPTTLKDGTVEGGLAAFSGTVQAIKMDLKRKLGSRR